MSARVIEKSVLFPTSSNGDIQYGGGLLAVAGLRPVPKKDIETLYQIKYRAEVAQVVTVAGTSYTPTAGTIYSVLVYDQLRVEAGYNEAPVPYTFTTPLVLTTIGATAADQREYIHGQLVIAINADASNHSIAVSLGTGTGFTVTDDGGYYPPRAQNMTNVKGINTVKPLTNSDGTGFAATNFSITTAGVYSSGVGARLLAQAPVVDFTFGNLISGTFTAPATFANPQTYAVSGQNYDIFGIGSLKSVEGTTLTNQYVYQIEQQFAVVDNGSGAATTNLAGFLTFEREFRKNMSQFYNRDLNAVIQWFDQDFIEQAPLGAAPSGTAAASNKFLTPYGSLVHYQIGTQTIVTGAQGASGFLIEQDLTATEGAAYFPNLGTVNSQQFIVGKSPITVSCKASFTTPANIVFMVGLRAKEAAAAGFATYTKLALVGTGSAGTFFTTYGALATASTVTTISAASALTTVQYDYRIVVGTDGVVSAYANNVKYPIYSAGTTPLVFAAGTVLIPHLQYTNLNSATAVANVTELVAVASDQYIS